MYKNLKIKAFQKKKNLQKFNENTCIGSGLELLKQRETTAWVLKPVYLKYVLFKSVMLYVHDCFSSSVEIQLSQQVWVKVTKNFISSERK